MKIQLQDVREADNRVNDVQGAESQSNEVKVQFADETSSDNLAPLEDIDSEDENRDKRSGFGASTTGGGLGGGSGGGSGNFLFDIIRVRRLLLYTCTVCARVRVCANDEANNQSPSASP